MNLTDVRDGLTTRLEAIDGLGVSSTVPSSIMQTPTIGIGIGSIDYGIDNADNIAVTYSLILYLSRGGSDAWAQLELDEWLTAIPEAITSDPTLDGAADFALVTRAEVLGTADVGGTSYVVAEFTVEAVGA